MLSTSGGSGEMALTTPVRSRTPPPLSTALVTLAGMLISSLIAPVTSPASKNAPMAVKLRVSSITGANNGPSRPTTWPL